MTFYSSTVIVMPYFGVTNGDKMAFLSYFLSFMVKGKIKGGKKMHVIYNIKMEIRIQREKGGYKVIPILTINK